MKNAKELSIRKERRLSLCEHSPLSWFLQQTEKLVKSSGYCQGFDNIFGVSVQSVMTSGFVTKNNRWVSMPGTTGQNGKNQKGIERRKP